MKPSSTSLWFTGAIVALLAGSHLLIVRPMNQQRAFLERDNAQKRTTLTSFDRSVESVHAVSRNMEGLRPAIALFDLKLGSGREMNKVLEDLWRLAEANSLQTRTVRTPPGKRIESLGEQEIEISVVGSFGGFYQFLLQLEEMKRIVRLNKLQVTKMMARDGQVQADLTLSVFYAAGPI